MTEIVMPNEIAQGLGVTGLRFRNWLREQKVAGHPLVASHQHGTRYRFTRSEADLLASEFALQVLGKTAALIQAKGPSSKVTSDHSAAHPARSQAKREPKQVEYRRSDDPGHRVAVEWMGENIETLDDLLSSGLRAIAVGINPAPESVAAGHYYQGNYGRTFFRRLRRAGLLPDGEGFDDDLTFSAGIGFTDVVKRPTPSKKSLRPGELEIGRSILEAKLNKLDVPLVIFVFKSAAETLLGSLPPHFFGIVARRQLGRARVFVMPAPTAARAIESDAIKKLKLAMRSASLAGDPPGRTR